MNLDIEALQRALVQRDELHLKTEQLNAQIVRVEEIFRSYKLGVRASVILKADDNGTDLLTWAKHSNEWRLLYEYSPVKSETQTEPLVNASRARRLRSVPMFSALARAIGDAVLVEIKTVEKATAEVEAFTRQMKEPTR